MHGHPLQGGPPRPARRRGLQGPAPVGAGSLDRGGRRVRRVPDAALGRPRAKPAAAWSQPGCAEGGLVSDWLIYRGTGEPHGDLREKLPLPPSWRRFESDTLVEPELGSERSAFRRLGDPARAAAYRASEEEIELVNAALYLRRPLLV